MSGHIPTQVDYEGAAAVSVTGSAIDCSCGRRGELYSTPIGARLAFMEHVVTETASSADWAETYTVEVDWSYVGDAS